MGGPSYVSWIIVLLCLSAIYPAVMFLIRGTWRMALALLIFVPFIGWIALWILHFALPRPAAAGPPPPAA